jgi:hypothetical protein
VPPQDKTIAALQADEYNAHPMMGAPSSDDGTLQKPQPLPPCSKPAEDGSIPTGVIASGTAFCVDVGAISRERQGCDTSGCTWTGNLTIPVLFDNDPRFWAS